MVGMTGATVVSSQPDSHLTKKLLAESWGQPVVEGNEMAQWVLKVNGNIMLR